MQPVPLERLVENRWDWVEFSANLSDSHHLKGLYRSKKKKKAAAQFPSHRKYFFPQLRSRSTSCIQSVDLTLSTSSFSALLVFQKVNIKKVKKKIKNMRMSRARCWHVIIQLAVWAFCQRRSWKCSPSTGTFALQQTRINHVLKKTGHCSLDVCTPGVFLPVGLS